VTPRASAATVVASLLAASCGGLAEDGNVGHGSDAAGPDATRDGARDGQSAGHSETDGKGDVAAREGGARDGSELDVDPCGPGGEGLVTLFASAEGYRVNALAVDSTSVYWTLQLRPTNMGGSRGPKPPFPTVMKAPLCGGTPTTIATTTSLRTAGDDSILTLGPTGVYSAGFSAPCYSMPDATATSYVAAVGPDGGAPAVLATGPWWISSIAVDARTVYWTDDPGLHANCSDTPYDAGAGSVVSAPLAGGEPTTIASAQSIPGSIAVDSTSVYWATATGLMMSPRGGGPPVTVAPSRGSGDASLMAVSGRRAYWVDGPPADACSFDDAGAVVGAACTVSLMSVPLEGGAPTTLVSAPLSTFYPTSLAVDGTSVYWTDCNGFCSTKTAPTLKKVQITGGAPTTLYTFSPSAYLVGPLAVDATSLYFVEGSMLEKLTPK
jgi:hypothetical protein